MAAKMPGWLESCPAMVACPLSLLSHGDIWSVSSPASTSLLQSFGNMGFLLLLMLVSFIIFTFFFNCFFVHVFDYVSVASHYSAFLDCLNPLSLDNYSSAFYLFQGCFSDNGASFQRQLKLYFSFVLLSGCTLEML